MGYQTRKNRNGCSGSKMYLMPRMLACLFEIILTVLQEAE